MNFSILLLLAAAPVFTAIYADARPAETFSASAGRRQENGTDTARGDDTADGRRTRKRNGSTTARPKLIAADKSAGSVIFPAWTTRRKTATTTEKAGQNDIGTRFLVRAPIGCPKGKILIDGRMCVDVFPDGF